MSTYNTKTYFLSSLLFCIVVFYVPYTHADTENLSYDYDDDRQVREVIYQDGTTVDYSYDTSENRITKDTATSEHTNSAPNAFLNYQPDNGAIDVGLPVTLEWYATTDPDAGEGDVVSYDIYLDTVSPSEKLIASGHQTNSYLVVGLKPGTEYFWKVVARDNHNATTVGSDGTQWSFATDVASVMPDAEFSAYPNYVIGDVDILFTDTSTSHNP